MEVFDILDDDGHVVDRVPRDRVHEEGLWHRAVHVLVFDSDGRLYLQKRSDTKDLYPGVWTSSASGHPASGEGWLAAAQRELEEELGIVAELAEVGAFRYDGGDDREVSRLYAARHDGPMDPDPDEVADGRWVAPADLEDELDEDPKAFAPSFHEAWRCYAGEAVEGPP